MNIYGVRLDTKNKEISGKIPIQIVHKNGQVCVKVYKTCVRLVSPKELNKTDETGRKLKNLKRVAVISQRGKSKILTLYEFVPRDPVYYPIGGGWYEPYAKFRVVRK